jgi:thiosulfate dehydrogenase (quinone) large subunit
MQTINGELIFHRLHYLVYVRLIECSMTQKFIKLFLRLSISAGFLSAVADRFGWWSASVSAWGNWDKFLEYTKVINPWVPDGLIPAIAAIATGAEIIFAFFLLIGLKTELVARLSGFLLLAFGLSMTFSTGVKGPFDYSVFSASAGAFALSLLTEKYLEVDSLISKGK